jgi:hypothetical protein
VPRIAVEGVVKQVGDTTGFGSRFRVLRFHWTES